MGRLRARGAPRRAGASFFGAACGLAPAATVIHGAEKPANESKRDTRFTHKLASLTPQISDHDSRHTLKLYAVRRTVLDRVQCSCSTSAADYFETPQVLKVYSYLCYLGSTNGNPWLPWSPWLPRFPKQLNLAFTTVLGLESNNTDYRVIFSGFRFCYRGSGEFWNLGRKVATIFCDCLG